MVDTAHSPRWDLRAWLARRPWQRWFQLRLIMPRTLFGRSLLLIVLPVLLTQVVTAYYFYQQHWETMTSRLAQAVAGEIRLVIDGLDSRPDPESQHAWFDTFAETLHLTVTLDDGATLRPRPRVPGHWILQSELEWALNAQVDRPFHITPQILDRWAEIEIQLDSGVLHVLVPRERLFSETSLAVMLWMAGSGIVLIIVALLFMRNQVRPIRRLASAAEKLGKGRDIPDFRPAGAREVRRAAWAFLLMRERIRRQIDQRTEMLAGVSHDLRTPLTRMKLSLEMLGDSEDAADLRADVAQMETMIESYLAFARDGAVEASEPVDLVAFVEDACRDARREGAEIMVIVEGQGAGRTMEVKPQALRRCLDNLLSNACTHATRIRATVRLGAKQVTVLVDDNGPGIPADRREEVLLPFRRLDTARNLDSGGSGLGLTIAKDIVRNHGGQMVLDDSPLGGLRCVVTLPR
ncbi:MAG: HAMP domain-containing protein [Rhodospirillaceae bacterium]|nr:HAMP domain-containing protein [Rhodospirillaceae bacterium]MCA8933623.1 HAMP domain-containing protein [Rhodospirillaceae bacterium]